MIFSCPAKEFPKMVTIDISLYGNYGFCYITVYRNGTRIGEVLSDEGMEGNDGSFEFAVGDKIKLDGYHAQYKSHSPTNSIDVITSGADFEGVIRGESTIYCEI